MNHISNNIHNTETLPEYLEIPMEVTVFFFRHGYMAFDYDTETGKSTAYYKLPYWICKEEAARKGQLMLHEKLPQWIKDEIVKWNNYADPEFNI